MLSIDKELFQWEKNRYVSVDEERATHVQFYNEKSSSAKEVNIVDGKAKIPNDLLKERLPIMAVACDDREGNSIALTRREFKVIERKIPETFVEEDEDEETIYDGGVIE